MKALVLHAHPDDELLFAHSLMASRAWDWTTVSLTGGARASEYRGVSLGMRDDWRVLSVPEYREWRSAVKGLGLSPDLTFTHNRMGEYGHPHHMAVHKIAHELFEPVWDFYVDAESSVGPQDADVITTVEVDGTKSARFREVYGEGVLEELWANQPELMASAFRSEQFTGTGEVPA